MFFNFNIYANDSDNNFSFYKQSFDQQVQNELNKFDRYENDACH